MPVANCNSNLKESLFRLLRNSVNKHEVAKNISCSSSIYTYIHTIHIFLVIYIHTYIHPYIHKIHI